MVDDSRFRGIYWFPCVKKVQFGRVDETSTDWAKS
jgi:hypothetical protein